MDEGDIGQSRAAEPGPQLESLLKHLLVFLVGRVFDDDGVIIFAYFAMLLGLAFALLQDIYKSRGEPGSETNFTISSCNTQLG
jgi:hypothetical protein